MKVGSLVECIDDSTPPEGWECIPPIRKNIYTIRGITPCHDAKGSLGLGIHTEEVINLCNPFGFEYAWAIERFREIQPPMEISIESLLEELVLV